MGLGSVWTKLGFLSVEPLESFSSFDSQLFASLDVFFALGLAGVCLILTNEIGCVLTAYSFGFSKSFLKSANGVSD